MLISLLIKKIVVESNGKRGKKFRQNMKKNIYILNNIFFSNKNIKEVLKMLGIPLKLEEIRWLH